MNLQIVDVATSLIEQGLREGFVFQHARVSSGLPDGARLVGARFEEAVVSLAFQHPSFPEAPDGALDRDWRELPRRVIAMERAE